MKDLDKILKVPVKDHFSSASQFQRYLDVLEVYWSGESEKTLKLVAEEIHNSDGDETDALYYRLWIEQLAELNDQATLAYLEKHFVRLQGTDILPDDTLRAFRGLIHLELDEIKLSRHIYDLLQEKNENPQALEFCQKYELRHCDDGKETLKLLKAKKPIMDYFAWKSCTEVCLLSGEEEGLDRLLKFIEFSFSKTPLGKEFRFYKSLDLNDLKNSEKEAGALVSAYPGKSDYLFMKAYVLANLGKNEESNKILSEFLKKFKKDDPDIYSLLGYNSYVNSFGDIYSKHWEKAIQYFLKAEGLLAQEGLPANEMILKLSLIQQHEAQESQKTEERKKYHYWLVNMTARDFSSLMSSSQEKTSFQFHKMGSSTREGDLVFFSSNVNHTSQSYLGAVYEVLSAPIWNHLDGYETMLQLVKKFERPIPLSSQFSFEDEGLFLDIREQLAQKSTKGNYLLSARGLSELSEELLEYLDEPELKAAFQELVLKKA